MHGIILSEFFFQMFCDFVLVGGFKGSFAELEGDQKPPASSLGQTWLSIGDGAQQVRQSTTPLLYVLCLYAVVDEAEHHPA